MFNQKIIACIGSLLSLCLLAPAAYAQDDDGLGQTIQIYTRFSSFIGKPSWLLIIRDLDHGQNIPYLFEIRKGDNFWIAFTYSRNYLVSVSNLQIETYRSRYNKFKNYQINDFCNLESAGRIIRGESLYITINGDLSPDRETYTCNVSRYPDGNFTVVTPSESDSDTAN